MQNMCLWQWFCKNHTQSGQLTVFGWLAPAWCICSGGTAISGMESAIMSPEFWAATHRCFCVNAWRWCEALAHGHLLNIVYRIDQLGDPHGNDRRRSLENGEGQ
jgi:hypothetical protein